jgi:hypothetical protein
VGQRLELRSCAAQREAKVVLLPAFDDDAEAGRRSAMVDGGSREQSNMVRE